LQRFSRGLDEPNASLRRDAFDLKRPRGMEFIVSCSIASGQTYSEDAATTVKKS